MHSDQKVWHGEENIATWKVFESNQGSAFAVKMFNQFRNVPFVSETQDSEKRKIEIIFNKPILFDKLVLIKSQNFKR